jgi:excinuclease UvrABC nuclease subunit
MMGRKRMNKRPFTKKNIEEVPNVPGVYELLDADGDAVYVGKSNHLRDRLYDHLGEFRNARFFRVRFMPPKAAERVEDRIIREKKPKHNVRKW